MHSFITSSITTFVMNYNSNEDRNLINFNFGHIAIIRKFWPRLYIFFFFKSCKFILIVFVRDKEYIQITYFQNFEEKISRYCSSSFPDIFWIPERITCNVSQTRTTILPLIQQKSQNCRYVTFTDSAFASWNVLSRTQNIQGYCRGILITNIHLRE